MECKKPKGFFLASTGSILFGVSGVLAQILFKRTVVSPGWLVNLRMTCSGVFLLFFLGLTGNDILSIWKRKSERLQLILFGIMGVLFAQSSFLKAVYFGNAAVAPILQSMGPMFVVIAVAIICRSLPNRLDTVSNLICLFGIFLLVTNGDIQKLYVSPKCLFWGVCSAIGVASYTLLPRKLLHNYSPLTVVGWGLTIGGITSNFLTPIWHFPNNLNFLDVLIMCIIVFAGTLMAYAMYISSLNYLKPSLACILGVLEPIVATLLTVTFLGERFHTIQLIGGGVTIAAIILNNLLTDKNYKGLSKKN
ncbi:DMT family transporter [Levilactobacillus brevis]|uniref:DMT family transporter n=1 Tax=Levilactobacillus brevis TaxID=1580 RepID=UPI000556D113|nr:EamA family transporter [Levilactobacillus brevis]